MSNFRGPLLAAPVLLAASLCACADGFQSPAAHAVSEQITQLEKDGKLPKLDRSTDLKGPETNNNGIRDDIDVWIAAQPITDVQMKAAQQMARVQQAKILVDLNDKAALLALDDQSMRGVSCIVDNFAPEVEKGSEMRGQLEAMMANTKERAKQYIAYNRAVSSSSGRLPSGNTCEP